MSREDGREEVLVTLEDLMTMFVYEEIGRDELAHQLNEIVQENEWVLKEYNPKTNVYVLEGIRAKILGISPASGVVVPFNLDVKIAA